MAKESESHPLTLKPSESSWTPHYFASWSGMCLWQLKEGSGNPFLYAFNADG